MVSSCAFVFLAMAVAFVTAGDGSGLYRTDRAGVFAVLRTRDEIPEGSFIQVDHGGCSLDRMINDTDQDQIYEVLEYFPKERIVTAPVVPLLPQCPGSNLVDGWILPELAAGRHIAGWPARGFNQALGCTGSNTAIVLAALDGAGTYRQPAVFTNHMFEGALLFSLSDVGFYKGRVGGNEGLSVGNFISNTWDYNRAIGGFVAVSPQYDPVCVEQDLLYVYGKWRPLWHSLARLPFYASQE